LNNLKDLSGSLANRLQLNENKILTMNRTASSETTSILQQLKLFEEKLEFYEKQLSSQPRYYLPTQHQQQQLADGNLTTLDRSSAHINVAPLSLLSSPSLIPLSSSSTTATTAHVSSNREKETIPSVTTTSAVPPPVIPSLSLSSLNTAAATIASSTIPPSNRDLPLKETKEAVNNEVESFVQEEDSEDEGSPLPPSYSAFSASSIHKPESTGDDRSNNNTTITSLKGDDGDEISLQLSSSDFTSGVPKIIKKDDLSPSSSLLQSMSYVNPSFRDDEEDDAEEEGESPSQQQYVQPITPVPTLSQNTSKLLNEWDEDSFDEEVQDDSLMKKHQATEEEPQEPGEAKEDEEEEDDDLLMTSLPDAMLPTRAEGKHVNKEDRDDEDGDDDDEGEEEGDDEQFDQLTEQINKMKSFQDSSLSKYTPPSATASSAEKKQQAPSTSSVLESSFDHSESSPVRKRSYDEDDEDEDEIDQVLHYEQPSSLPTNKKATSLVPPLSLGILPSKTITGLATAVMEGEPMKVQIKPSIEEEEDEDHSPPLHRTDPLLTVASPLKGSHVNNVLEESDWDASVDASQQMLGRKKDDDEEEEESNESDEGESEEEEEESSPSYVPSTYGRKDDAVNSNKRENTDPSSFLVNSFDQSSISVLNDSSNEPSVPSKPVVSSSATTAPGNVTIPKLSLASLSQQEVKPEPSLIQPQQTTTAKNDTSTSLSYLENSFDESTDLSTMGDAATMLMKKKKEGETIHKQSSLDLSPSNSVASASPITTGGDTGSINKQQALR
jgi:hypothetical protein